MGDGLHFPPNQWKIGSLHHQTLLNLQDQIVTASRLRDEICCKNKAFLCFTQICLLKYLF